MSGSKVVTKEHPAKIKPEVDSLVLALIAPSVAENSYVYVHCHFSNGSDEALIRIWKTTFLIDQHTGTRSQLIHAENISIAPIWTIIPNKKVYNFILIFSALPKSCKQFDLVEEIPQPGGFFVKNIVRNGSDVYHVTMN